MRIHLELPSVNKNFDKLMTGCQVRHAPRKSAPARPRSKPMPKGGQGHEKRTVSLETASRGLLCKQFQLCFPVAVCKIQQPLPFFRVQHGVLCLEFYLCGQMA
jgi:hypothetical protein